LVFPVTADADTREVHNIVYYCEAVISRIGQCDTVMTHPFGSA